MGGMMGGGGSHTEQQGGQRKALDVGSALRCVAGSGGPLLGAEEGPAGALADAQVRGREGVLSCCLHS